MCWAVFAVSRCERPKLAPLEYFLPRKNRITKKTVPDREFRSVFTRMHAARMHAARTHARTRACKRGTCGTRASLRAGHGPPRPAAPARGAPSAAPTCHACPLAQRAADTCHRCRQLHGAQLECTAPSFGARRGSYATNSWPALPLPLAHSPSPRHNVSGERVCKDSARVRDA